MENLNSKRVHDSFYAKEDHFTVPKEYFKEAQDLYQASANTEKEMLREERASREQAEFDKAQREAFGLSEEQQGELADRQRKKQKSQQYLQSRGGMSSRQAQKSGMVMIPQARPV